MSYLVGLDLAQSQDYTAVSVLRRTIALDKRTGNPLRDRFGEPVPQFACVHLERYRGEMYPAIVERIVKLLRKQELGANPMLVLDATGVGRPVLDMFRNEYVGDSIVMGITLTGGQTATATGKHEWNVSKVLIVSAMQTTLQTGRLKISPKLKLGDIAKSELLNYRVKVTAAANEIYTAKDSEHDDVVISLCLPIYVASQRWGQAQLPSFGPDPDDVLEQAQLQAAEADRREKKAAADWEAHCFGGDVDFDLDDPSLWEANE